MLKKVGSQYVVDEENEISFEATGPYSFLYKNKNLEATISSEPLKDDKGNYSVCLYLSDLDEWDKPENRPINDDERDAIHGHATQALQLLGMKVEIE